MFREKSTPADEGIRAARAERAAALKAEQAQAAQETPSNEAPSQGPEMEM